MGKSEEKRQRQGRPQGVPRKAPKIYREPLDPDITAQELRREIRATIAPKAIVLEEGWQIVQLKVLMRDKGCAILCRQGGSDIFITLNVLKKHKISLLPATNYAARIDEVDQRGPRALEIKSAYEPTT